MFIHFKLNLSLYDDNEIYDKYGSYTSFNIPDKYIKYITNGKTSKKVLTLLHLFTFQTPIFTPFYISNANIN